MVQVNSTLCDLCGTCVGVCPVDAVVLTVREAAVDHAVCIKCLACIQVCPVGALAEEQS